MSTFKTEFLFSGDASLKLNDSSLNELLRIHGDLALEFWIKPTDFHEHARILSFDRPLGVSPGSGNKVFVLQLGTDGHFYFSHDYGSGSTINSQPLNDTPLNLGELHHVLFQRDSSNGGLLEIWIDGQYAGGDANTFEHAYSYSENGSASVFEIGGSEYSDNAGHPNNFSGLLADIRVYNELLTPDEITERFKGNELLDQSAVALFQTEQDIDDNFVILGDGFKVTGEYSDEPFDSIEVSISGTSAPSLGSLNDLGMLVIEGKLPTGADVTLNTFILQKPDGNIVSSGPSSNIKIQNDGKFTAFAYYNDVDKLGEWTVVGFEYTDKSGSTFDYQFTKPLNILARDHSFDHLPQPDVAYPGADYLPVESDLNYILLDGGYDGVDGFTDVDQVYLGSSLTSPDGGIYMISLWEETFSQTSDDPQFNSGLMTLDGEVDILALRNSEGETKNDIYGNPIIYEPGKGVNDFYFSADFGAEYFLYAAQTTEDRVYVGFSFEQKDPKDNYVDFSSMQAVKLDDGNYMVFFHNGAEPDGLTINYVNTPDPSGDVYYQIVDVSGNSIGDPQVVNTTTYHGQAFPKAIGLADGTFVAAWSQSQNGSSFAVGYQRFASDGSRIGDEVLLTTTDAPIGTIVLTADDLGGFQIYAGRTDETFDIDALKLDDSAKTFLGSGDDTFYGDIENDYVETGGGDDRIMSEGGDDHIVVQGAGEVIVDVGSGRDIVEVDPAFVGGLTITNGQETEVEASSLTIVIDKPAWRLKPASDTATNTDYKITLDGGENEILIKDYFFTDEEGYVTTNDISIRHQGWDGWDAGYTGMMWESVRGSNQDNLLYSSVYDRDKTDDYVPVVEDDIVYSMSGWAGDDVFHVGGGLNQIFGGTGDDAFHIDLVAQNTSIIGDNEVSVDGQYVNPSLKEDGLPDYDTVNTNYSDAAYFSFEWPTLIDNPDFNPNAVEDANNPRYLKDPDSYIEQLGKGHFKVHHKLENGEEINVEMYDVEGAYFSDGEGGLEYHALTTGRPITSDDFGNLKYETNDVKFWVEHNDADYEGATTIAVVTTATKTVTDPVTKQRISYEEPTVKWKGLATEADSFVFSDVTINVINVAQTDLTGVPIEDTTVYGTSGIDLIIGDEFDNLIFGGDDNDIIFGGAGNDEIYGEGGDDVLIGGIGEDILYGDYHEDALKPAEELDTRGKVMNASELDGDDIIVGGAGVDKIDSGEGQNVAASGDLSSVILNAELDEMHTFLDYDEDDLPV